MSDSLVVKIIESIAEEEGVQPKELDLILQDHVEAEAIRLLDSHETASWELSFDLPDHKVTVTTDGSVIVNSDKQKRQEVNSH